MEKAFYKLLADASGVSVFALVAPQKQKPPYVIFQRADAEEWKSVNGCAGIDQVVMQIDCYALKYYDAKAIAKAIRAAISGFKGEVAPTPSAPTETTKFAGISFQNDTDALDQTDEPHLYRVSTQYLVTHHL